MKSSFCVGGKDGVPYPVDKPTYDEMIEILENAIKQARWVTKISSMPLRGFGFSQISEIQALFCGLNYVRSRIYIKDQDYIIS